MIRRSQYTAALAVLASCATGCSAPPAAPGALRVVAVERVYGDLARQIAGKSVTVSTILDSPSADPHAYEPTTADADAIARADLVIENGLGYDAFADKLLAASPRAGRVVIVAGALAGHHVGDNPHVWYEARTLRLLIAAIDRWAARNEPMTPGRSRRVFALFAWVDRFVARTKAVGRRHPGARVAITEPVFDYVLRAAHLIIATPPAFSHAIEEGNDPAPQDIDTMDRLLATKSVAAFVYNRQTQEPSTTHLLAIARQAGVGIVPVTETLPPGESTQTWIDGEVAALDRTL